MRRPVIVSTVCLAGLLGGCSLQPQETAPLDGTNSATDPRNLALDALVVDTHIDVPYRLYKKTADVSRSTADGDFDYPRASAGGLNAAFMSIYIPAAVDEAGDAYAFAEQSIELVEGLASAAPNQFAIATCTADVERVLGSSQVALPMGMENGGPIMGSMATLRHFRDRGIRYVTLTHSKSNHISDSSYDDNKRWQGLSAFGKELVPEMNRLGVMIDISHVSDQAYWQALELSAVPVIASHSSLRHFTPGFERNMSDDMVRALGEAGGVIQINYGSSFLTQAAQDYGKATRAAAAAFASANGLAADASELADFAKQYRLDHAYPFANLGDVLDHIDRAVQLAGIDAVGIGSDYDGVGDSLPIGLKDASTYPNLVTGLEQRGYQEADIRKILGENLMRVWRSVEAYAAAAGEPVQCRSASTSANG